MGVFVLLYFSWARLCYGMLRNTSRHLTTNNLMWPVQWSPLGIQYSKNITDVIEEINLKRVRNLPGPRTTVGHRCVPDAFEM